MNQVQNLSPSDVDAAVQRALGAFQAGRRAECLRLLRDLGPAAADHPLALQVMAIALGNEASADAYALLERAVRIGPGDPQAHYNLACTVQAQGDFPRAISHYEATLRLDPGHTGAMNNLSDLYRRRGRAAEGWALLERYRAAGAPVDGLEIRLAKLAMDLRRFKDAAYWFSAAERRAPQDASVQFEYSMLTLAERDFARGFPQYDHRILVHGLANLGIYPHAMPLWTGEPIPGKRLLLHREQGLGDMIMFAQAFDEIIEEGAELHLALHPPLARLMAASFPKAKVWASLTTVGTREQPQQPWLRVCGPLHRQAPICSLGTLRRAKGFPAARRYMRAVPRDAELWRHRLDALAPGQGRRIGLCLGSRQTGWSDDGRQMAFRKSIPPREAEELSSVTNVRWIALHDRETAGILADVPGVSIADPSHWITDLADTAAIIENLDLVITIDSVVAHLAGAMGKETWLLLWWNPDWRWGIEETESYLYPHMRLFRQDTAGDWRGLLKKVANALSA
jgi:tetratricopeptide (TPR) repeat protein